MPTGAAQLGTYAVAAIHLLNAHAGSMFGDDGSREGEKHRVAILDDLRAGVPLFDIFLDSDVANDAVFDDAKKQRLAHAAHALDGDLWGDDADPDRLMRVAFIRGIEVSLGLEPGQDAQERSRYWYLDFGLVPDQPMLYATLRAVDHRNGDGHVTMTVFTPGTGPLDADYLLRLEGPVDPVWHVGQHRALWYVYEIAGQVVTVEPTLEVGGEEPWERQVGARG